MVLGAIAAFVIDRDFRSAPDLYKGPITLSDGRVVDGILYPRELAEGHHRDISEYGGWRAYWASRET